MNLQVHLRKREYGEKVISMFTQNIRIFPKINKKKDLQNISLSSLKYVYLCTQYLVGAPLAQMTASVRCGMEAISLWHCWGTIEPSARLDCWIDCFLGLGIVCVFFDTGTKTIILKRYWCLNGAWTDNYKKIVLPINNWIGH